MLRLLNTSTYTNSILLQVVRLYHSFYISLHLAAVEASVHVPKTVYIDFNCLVENLLLNFIYYMITM